MPKSVNPAISELIKEIAAFDDEQIKLPLANAAVQFPKYQNFTFPERAEI